MKKLPIKPETVTRDLLKRLPERSRQILERRYGIGKNTKKETLEAIGKDYKITRERVRQIENHALGKLKDNLLTPEITTVSEHFKETMAEHGHIAEESSFLETLGENTTQKNHLYFLLMLVSGFSRIRENNDFHNRWKTDTASQKKVEEALLDLHKKLSEAPLSEKEMLSAFLDCLPEKNETPEATLASWLRISKRVAKNPFGEWGLVDSPYIRPRGIRDLAYLFMRKHGSPMHFREVASGITDTLQHSAHPQTVHNELIKDTRFVLVGRGLYALTEWGYQPGIVRNVIQAILKQHGPITRDELVKRVLKERHVKENTIVINLQNKKFFKKTDNGKYALA
ncbi:MAG: sigma factor-like helix-turn-helix DNA-binding protein [bacterium]|nr:sigma factor-like helix-turn-helix DNA-binding protein [bacterium]